MRLLLRLTGNVLIGLSVIGAAALGILLLGPDPTAQPAPVTQGPAGSGGAAVVVAPRPLTESGVLALPSRSDAVRDQSLAADPPAPYTASASPSPITRLAVPAIDLAVDVVPADLVQREDGLTWEVPAFKVGHAAGTAGAGSVGNAILLGHVTSVHSGNVFQNLDRVRLGDRVEVYSNARAYAYQVVSTQRIPRSDASVLDQSGAVSAVSLITCTGVWLPTIWDYTERLVVRAELVETR